MKTQSPFFSSALRGFTLCVLAVILGGTLGLAQTPLEASFEKILPTGGKITYAARETNPTLTAPDGKVIGDHLPPRTVIRLTLTPVQGSNINVEIWLPDAAQWNGRFLGLGNGGAAGHINPAGLARRAASGYAAATTDMGTAPNPGSGIDNPEVWKDFGFRATHLMTLAAKEAIRQHFGKPADYAYFVGGSTGGQQAVQEAQRYPEDYDGIVADVPAHCRTPLHAYFLWNYQILKRCPFTDSQEQNVIAAGIEFAANRGEPAAQVKTVVADPRASKQEIETVIKRAMEKDPTLTEAHADALRKLFDGPHHAVTGQRIFNGIPLGTGFKPACGNLYLFQWVFGGKKDLMGLNFGADIDTYTAKLGPYLNAENPDLTAFEKRGSKLILMSGAADSCVPYHATLDYYERLIEHFGSLEAVQSFCRFYLVPGMGHGGGDGPGVNQHPDVLANLIAWREKGTPPNRLIGRRVAAGEPPLEWPLYPYPARSGVETANGQPIPGLRGGVERVSQAFRPAAAQ